MKKTLLLLASSLLCASLFGLSSCGNNGTDQISTQIDSSIEVVTIQGVSLDANGNLIVTYSDGTTKNLGNVKGTDGKSIASAIINDNNELVLTYTDNSTTNLGSVKGADGKSIASASINDSNELVLTYTDGTTSNLGVVVGTNGNDYVKATYTVTFTDGENVTTKTFQEGSPIELPEASKDGYTFDGWYTEDGIKVTSLVAVYTDLNLTANYVKNAEYITLQVNGKAIDINPEETLASFYGYNYPVAYTYSKYLNETTVIYVNPYTKVKNLNKDFEYAVSEAGGISNLESFLDVTSYGYVAKQYGLDIANSSELYITTYVKYVEEFMEGMDEAGFTTNDFFDISDYSFTSIEDFYTSYENALNKYADATKDLAITYFYDELNMKNYYLSTDKIAATMESLGHYFDLGNNACQLTTESMELLKSKEVSFNQYTISINEMFNLFVNGKDDIKDLVLTNEAKNALKEIFYNYSRFASNATKIDKAYISLDSLSISSYTAIIERYQDEFKFDTVYDALRSFELACDLMNSYGYYLQNVNSKFDADSHYRKIADEILFEEFDKIVEENYYDKCYSKAFMQGYSLSNNIVQVTLNILDSFKSMYSSNLHSFFPSVSYNDDLANIDEFLSKFNHSFEDVLLDTYEAIDDFYFEFYDGFESGLYKSRMGYIYLSESSDLNVTLDKVDTLLDIYGGQVEEYYKTIYGSNTYSYDFTNKYNAYIKDEKYGYYIYFKYNEDKRAYEYSTYSNVSNTEYTYASVDLENNSLTKIYDSTALIFDTTKTYTLTFTEEEQAAALVGGNSKYTSIVVDVIYEDYGFETYYQLRGSYSEQEKEDGSKVYVYSYTYERICTDIVNYATCTLDENGNIDKASIMDKVETRLATLSLASSNTIEMEDEGYVLVPYKANLYLIYKYDAENDNLTYYNYLTQTQYDMLEQYGVIDEYYIGEFNENNDIVLTKEAAVVSIKYQNQLALYGEGYYTASINSNYVYTYDEETGYALFRQDTTKADKEKGIYYYYYYTNSVYGDKVYVDLEAKTLSTMDEILNKKYNITFNANGEGSNYVYTSVDYQGQFALYTYAINNEGVAYYQFSKMIDKPNDTLYTLIDLDTETKTFTVLIESLDETLAKKYADGLEANSDCEEIAIHLKDEDVDIVFTREDDGKYYYYRITRVTNDDDYCIGRFNEDGTIFVNGHTCKHDLALTYTGTYTSDYVTVDKKVYARDAKHSVYILLEYVDGKGYQYKGNYCVSPQENYCYCYILEDNTLAYEYLTYTDYINYNYSGTFTASSYVCENVYVALDKYVLDDELKECYGVLFVLSDDSYVFSQMVEQVPDGVTTATIGENKTLVFASYSDDDYVKVVNIGGSYVPASNEKYADFLNSTHYYIYMKIGDNKYIRFEYSSTDGGWVAKGISEFSVTVCEIILDQSNHTFTVDNMPYITNYLTYAYASIEAASDDDVYYAEGADYRVQIYDETVGKYVALKYDATANVYTCNGTYTDHPYTYYGYSGYKSATINSDGKLVLSE